MAIAGFKGLSSQTLNSCLADYQCLKTHSEGNIDTYRYSYQLCQLIDQKIGCMNAEFTMEKEITRLGSELQTFFSSATCQTRKSH